MSSMKSDDQVLADRDDLEMFQRPHLWPYGHKLPLRRELAVGDWPQDRPLFGHLSAGKGRPIVNYDLERWIEYASFQELYDDGWRVD